MLSFAEHLNAAQYPIVDDRAHRGKHLVKEVILVLEKMAEKASKDSVAMNNLHKSLPNATDPTAQYAMEQFKAYVTQQAKRVSDLKREVSDGPVAEANIFLNNYRIEWPELQELAKEANRELNDLQKNEKSLRKRSAKAHNADEHLKQNIEQNRERLSSGMSSFTTAKSVKGGHSRSRTTGGLVGSWFRRKSGDSEASGATATESGDRAASSPDNKRGSSRSMRKIEKKVNKMVTKAGTVAEQAQIAEQAHRKILAELDVGKTMHAAQMREILAGFQRLELRKSTTVRNVLLRCIHQHRDYYVNMVEQTNNLITAMEMLDPQEDCQYFVRTARRIKNPWRRVSGNVPIVSREYHTPVSSWQAQFDAETGSTFYVDSSTGETVWELPINVDLPPVYDDLDVCPSVHPLPSAIENERRIMEEQNREHATASTNASEWDAVTDDETGQIYYFNSMTGVSSWVWPPEPQDTEAPEALEEQEPYIEQEQEQEQEQEPYIERQRTRHNRSQSQPITIAEWALYTDPNSGLDYFFNEDTGETQWA